MLSETAAVWAHGPSSAYDHESVYSANRNRIHSSGRLVHAGLFRFAMHSSGGGECLFPTLL